MTGMPASVAFLITAPPESGSRLVMISALTPALIMPSAIVWNWVASPWAFWMSAWTPAASKAFWKEGRSAFSHRAEDSVSGRMTPILPVTAAELEAAG